jgi:hypothetical protein
MDASTKSEHHIYHVRPHKDHRGVDLISDVLPFGRLWYADYRSQAVKLRVTIRLAAS